LTIENIKKRLLLACDFIPAKVNAEWTARAKELLASWTVPPSRCLGYTVGGHATIVPNLTALHALGFDGMVHGPFDNIASGNKPYLEQIIRTTHSLLAERRAVDISKVERDFPPSPVLNLFSPSMMPAALELHLPDSVPREEKRAFQQALKLLSSQTGYNLQAKLPSASPAVGHESEPPVLHPLLRVRARELRLSTECMASLAAADLSATLRMPNDVNRTAGAAQLFASHHRSDSNKPQKRLSAFRQMQNRLKAAVPPELVQTIKDTHGAIRIVADAHLEWLDIDGLPLCIRRDASRIPVTPGNLFAGLVTGQPLLRLFPEAFSKVLVISAFDRTDPIQGMFETACAAFEPEWQDSIRVEFVKVACEEDLLAALNSFDGPLAMFDGHGSHQPDHPAVLHLQDTQCDVWQLSGKVRVPPIIVLSACDTHAASRNHATTVNGFLSLGARAVLGSVFPLEAIAAAVFAARLLYRVSTFVPAAVGVRDRALTWTEVVSGMLRMQLLTDFLRQLERKNLIDHATYIEVHEYGNFAINSEALDPFGEVIAMLEAKGRLAAGVRRELDTAVACSSVISYLNVGRPETILLDTPRRMAKSIRPRD
jgi:hypothetical protein